MLKRMLKRLKRIKSSRIKQEYKDVKASTLATLALRLGLGGIFSSWHGSPIALLLVCVAVQTAECLLTYSKVVIEYSENTLNKYRLQILIGFLLRYLNKGIDTVISDHSVNSFVKIKRHMPDLRRPAESSSWLQTAAFGIGLVVSAAIGLTAASKMGSIRQTRREQDTCDVDTKRYERTDVVATKKMTTRGDTNPNAVLKWINDNCIKLEPTETKEARNVIDTVSLFIITYFKMMCIPFSFSLPSLSDKLSLTR